MDFGYGSIGHLKLLASNGAQVVGVDPDSYLSAIYSQASDQGGVLPFLDTHNQARGSINLVHARWPKDRVAIDAIAAQAPFQLIISKNTLKRGYIKPERRADKRQLIDLGVSDDMFLRALHGALAPGGLVVIYNLAPKQAAPNEAYRPHADPRSPYSREQWQRAGFEVLAFDAEDHNFVRQMGVLLRWDQNEKGERVDDLETNLFAVYTIVKRPS